MGIKRAVAIIGALLMVNLDYISIVEFNQATSWIEAVRAFMWMCISATAFWYFVEKAREDEWPWDG